MPKPIPRPLHGVADYSYVALVFNAPELAGFKDEEVAARLCRILGGGSLAYTLLTRAEWGCVRVLPFRAHLSLDLLQGVFALGAPWVFGFRDNARARNTFLAMGITGILAGTMSRQEEMP